MNKVSVWEGIQGGVYFIRTLLCCCCFAFYFIVGVWLLYSVVPASVSAAQRCESAACTPKSPPSWASLPLSIPPLYVIPEHRAELPVYRAASCYLFYTGKWKSSGRLRLFATAGTIQSLEFCRPEYRSRQSFPSPGGLPNPGIEPRSPTLQVPSLPAEPQWKPKNAGVGGLSLLQGIFPTWESNRDLLHCR